MPTIHETSYIDKSAVIIGTVKIGKYCGVYPNVVIRGDQNTITINDGSNVQDCCVIHTNEHYSVHIGKNVSLGHCSMIHGATIEDDCLIGIHATIMNGAHIGRGSIVGAHALVTEGKNIPPHSLVIGVPGKIIKQDETFIASKQKKAHTYQQLTKNHLAKQYVRYQP